MADEKDLASCLQWFEEYTRSFFSRIPEGQEMLKLKLRHTDDVRLNMRTIAEAQDLDRGEQICAEMIALFHDVGRFPQFAAYQTFRDSISVNHGRLGAEVIEQHGILETLRTDERDLILTAVRYHNAYSIPPGLDANADFFLRMIRDADKLDIWRIFLELYEVGDAKFAVEAGHGLPDLPKCSDEVVAAVRNRKSASVSALQTMNDFKLMQLSWMYDLDFSTTAKIILERNYVPRLVAVLPRTDVVREIETELLSFLHERAEGDLCKRAK